MLDNVRVTVREAPAHVLEHLDARLAYLSLKPGDDAQRGAGAGQDDPESATGARAPWDGFVRFLRRPAPTLGDRASAPWFESGLLARALEALRELGHPVRVLDTRIRPAPSFALPPSSPDHRAPLFPYQEAAVEAALRAGRGVLVSPPRSGKTRALLELCRRLRLPVLWIAPTTSIVDQTAEAALAHGFAERDVVRLEDGTALLQADAPLWLCTAARMLQLSLPRTLSCFAAIAAAWSPKPSSATTARGLEPALTPVT